MWNWPAPDFLDHHKNPMGFALVQFLLVLPIVYIYRGYFSSGFKKLIKLHPNMDSLISIGASFSFNLRNICSIHDKLWNTAYDKCQSRKL